MANPDGFHYVINEICLVLFVYSIKQDLQEWVLFKLAESRFHML